MQSQSSPGSLTIKKKAIKDEKDKQIDKLKGINLKLRNKIKELNIIVEKAIEKANAKRLATQKDKNKNENVDVEYLLRVRDKEIANSEKQIANNTKEIEKLTSKYNELAETENVAKLEDQLKQAELKKKQYQRQIKELEQQNIEQGKTLDKVTNSQEYQNKIKYLMEDLRMWKDKNQKLESAFEKDKESRDAQVQRMKTLEEKNKQFQSQLQKLKEAKNNQMAKMEASQMSQQTSSTLPMIEVKNEEDKARLREELEEEYFKQRTELKKVEGKTKGMQQQADELKLKLKEKETMLRIAKFKLNEVNRNISFGQKTAKESIPGEEGSVENSGKPPRNKSKNAANRGSSLEKDIRALRNKKNSQAPSYNRDLEAKK